MAPLAPILLGPNFAEQPYRGGGRTARFRGLVPALVPAPEDWIASVTSRFGSATSGMTWLGNGELLRDAIAADPLGYLGEAHVAAFGNDPGLLVKLLDASERLVVHCHPDRDFAKRHLGCAHGKTEAWVVLEARENAEVYVGFQREVTRAELGAWVTAQAVDEMLAALHRVPVRAGSAILVPAGLPHAIGDGILVLELQEPTDFSVMLEQGQFSSGDLGLGFDVALGCVDCTRWSPARLQRLFGAGLSEEGPLLPAEAEPFFRAQRCCASSGRAIEPGFSVVVGISGSGTLSGSFEGEVVLNRGSTVLVPYAAGATRLGGDLEAIVCRPPAPNAPQFPRPAL